MQSTNSLVSGTIINYFINFLEEALFVTPAIIIMILDIKLMAFLFGETQHTA